ncbi:MAG: M3 family oligoendopeptidase [Solirubrobacteraceae bacterium]|jgi:oligoendopeptidase F|nr:M3 family oligoendopeptidase [Solirubrobacteraceae bacterium]
MTETAVQDVTWNLEDLVDGGGPEACDRFLAEAAERSAAFAERHAGRVAALDGPALATAMAELGAIADLVGRAGNYAHLRFAGDTADEANGALIAKVGELATAIETRLVFFDLEWAEVDDAAADALLESGGLEHVRHHLRTIRRYRPHLLSEPEEKLMAEKSVTGDQAWTRLFSELTSAVRVDLPGAEEAVPLDAALSLLSSPDRDVRRTTAEAVTAALEPGLRTRAYIFNTLLQDKATDDRLRSYPTWLSSRNLSNEASDASVQALLEAVEGAYDVPRRWYALKARVLGLERLADYDRAAAVADDDVEIGWDEGREIVLGAYREFSPDLGDLVERFFDERWIDAPARPGKRGGAFCAYTTPSVHPYVLLNWTSRRRDVMTLAHELGHGVHAALAIPRGIFEQSTPLTVAETASVFGEALTFRRLLDQADTPASRLTLLAMNLEDTIATVFRQTAMNRFEEAVHTTRREQGELGVEQFGDLWQRTQEDLLGDAVEITPGYRTWWSYIPHFIGSPGYVYAYAFGQLLALSVYGRYVQEGEAFVPAYLEMLAAGGSRSPEDLAAIAGLDLTDPGFWNAGLDLVRGELAEAEAAAEQVLAERGRDGAGAA